MKIVDLALGGPVRRWWTMLRRRSRCFHHDLRQRPDASWIETVQIIDYRKVWRCTACGKRWVL